MNRLLARLLPPPLPPPSPNLPHPGPKPLSRFESRTTSPSYRQIWAGDVDTWKIQSHSQIRNPPSIPRVLSVRANSRCLPGDVPENVHRWYELRNGASVQNTVIRNTNTRVWICGSANRDKECTTDRTGAHNYSAYRNEGWKWSMPLCWRLKLTEYQHRERKERKKEKEAFWSWTHPPIFATQNNVDPSP